MAGSLMSSLGMFLIVGAALILTIDFVSAKKDIDCRNISPECGDTIRRRVISSKGPPPPDECCVALVKIGKSCHDSYTKAHIAVKDYKGKTYPIVKRSEELWRECFAVFRFLNRAADAPRSS